MPQSTNDMLMPVLDRFRREIIKLLAEQDLRMQSLEGSRIAPRDSENPISQSLLLKHFETVYEGRISPLTGPL